MDRVIGAFVFVFGIFFLYLVLSRKLADFLAAITAPQLLAEGS